jgi:hypothetical protein
MFNEPRVSSYGSSDVVGQVFSAPQAKRGRFFQGMSIALLVLVLWGFGRTLFLRPLFDVPPMSTWFLYLHGIVMTTWFALLVVQTSLVNAGRTDLHRQLGVFGAVVASAVFALALATTLGFPAHVKAGRISSVETLGQLDFAAVSGIVWTDLGALVLFATFVAGGLRARRRPDFHRRLMLLAAIAVVLPAVARIQPFIAGIAALGAVLLGLLAYDIYDRRRPHVVTLLGMLTWLVVLVGTALVANTGVGRALISWLE